MKEKSGLITLIETNIANCIKALNARKDTLIREVNEKFETNVC
jgi:hypothetical protein